MCLGLGACTSIFYMANISEIKLSELAKTKDLEYQKARLGEEAALQI